MIIVSNTTPLIGLAVVGQFDLLRFMFGQITIPEAVFAEAVSLVEKGLNRRSRKPIDSRLKGRAGSKADQECEK
ncbi:MAG: hypothetical protein IPG51_16930 [Chloroflexi bacterium]|nr:hypothetical protein [Chloroflexota bacterium]